MIDVDDFIHDAYLLVLDQMYYRIFRDINDEIWFDV